MIVCFKTAVTPTEILKYEIPTNLYLDALLQKHPIKLTYRLNSNIPKIKDRIVILLSQIDKRIALNKAVSLADNNGFVNLNSVVLQNYASNYNEYFDWFLEAKILESDNLVHQALNPDSHKLVLFLLLGVGKILPDDECRDINALCLGITPVFPP